MDVSIGAYGWAGVCVSVWVVTLDCVERKRSRSGEAHVTRTVHVTSCCLDPCTCELVTHIRISIARISQLLKEAAHTCTFTHAYICMLSTDTSGVMDVTYSRMNSSRSSGFGECTMISLTSMPSITGRPFGITIVSL